ncbi:aspartate/glutamate racemase family protein [Pseudooceanicola sp. 502str34]
MKIGVIIANVGMTQAALEARRAFLMARARPGTQVEVLCNTEGPASMESVFESEEASTQIVRHMLRLQGQGYDAFIPWCAGDPGVIAGRERVDVPVVGPMQSACALANLLGYSFSVVSPNTDPRVVRARVRAMGLEGQLASARILRKPVLELRADLDATRTLIRAEIAKCVEEDRADAVVLACMALYGLSETLAAPVPVIDPATAALHMAETMVAMGLTHGRSAYPFPKET